MMTMIRPARGQGTTTTDAPVQWTLVQPDLWVGKAGGEFAGMIERRDEGYAAIRFAQLLGVFDTVSEAKASFAQAQ